MTPRADDIGNILPACLAVCLDDIKNRVANPCSEVVYPDAAVRLVKLLNRLYMTLGKVATTWI